MENLKPLLCLKCYRKERQWHYPTQYQFQAYLGLKLRPDEDEQPDVIVERLKELLSEDNGHFLNRFAALLSALSAP